MKIERVENLGGELQLIDVGRLEDRRGYFLESFRKSDLKNIIGEVVQINVSYSLPHVMRGLHFQANPMMGKLVRTVSGHMIDIVLDVRRGSPSYGILKLIDMPERPDKLQWLWVPPGYAHGNFFLAPTYLEYLCTGEYNPQSEFCISPMSKDFIKILADSSRTYDIFQAAITDPHVNITDKDKNAMNLTLWSGTETAKDFGYIRRDNVIVPKTEEVKS